MAKHIKRPSYALERQHAWISGSVLDDGFVGRVEILAFDHQSGAAGRGVGKGFTHSEALETAERKGGTQSYL